MADLPKEPITRQEEYLSRLAGENTTLPREPITREEMYLEGAIARVEAVEEEVEEIKNNPDVVDIVATYADLQAYDKSKLTDKDVIRVLADETHSGNSTYYRYNKSSNDFTFIAEIAAGGDSVYSDKTTSSSNTGGAVYIGNKNSNQEIVGDPTTTDNHYRYFWALPDINGYAPYNMSINILGRMDGSRSTNSVALQGRVNDSLQGVAIGSGCTTTGQRSVSLGANSTAGANYSVALGPFALTSRIGEVNIGTGTYDGFGFDNTRLRVLGGVHDGQLAQDAATVNQVNATIDAINAALGTSIPHIGATN